jgi:hypothetical protein
MSNFYHGILSKLRTTYSMEPRFIDANSPYFYGKNFAREQLFAANSDFANNNQKHITHGDDTYFGSSERFT